MNNPTDTKTIPAEKKDSDSKELKREMVMAMLARMKEKSRSPEAQERRKWRDEQRRILREMGMSTETIEEEILI